MEQELLAVVFSVTKFHQFVYGYDIKVHSDHKQLGAIIVKQLHTAPKRLQPILIRLQNYNVHLECKPGRYLYVVDTLNHAFLSDTPQLNSCEKELCHVNMLSHLPISPQRLREIQDHTSTNLKELVDVITKMEIDRR